MLAVMTPSPLWTSDYRAEVAMVAPNVEYVEIDTQHWIQFERPEELRALVGDFVDGLAAGE